jgi:lipoprotein NlpD
MQPKSTPASRACHAAASGVVLPGTASARTGHSQVTQKGVLLAGAALLALGACSDRPVDADLRGLGNGFSTSEAALNLPDRPRPDDRGVISYPNYQVVVAQGGDTVRSVAGRVGVDAEALARFNGISPDVELRRDEIIALPGRVAEPSLATGMVASAPMQPAGAIDVTTLASSAIDRAGPQQTLPQPAAQQAGQPITPAPAAQQPGATPTPAAQPAPAAVAPTPAAPVGTEPIRHRVERGETIYSVARLYNVPVRSIAEWNGIGADLAVREGQFLLIPVAGATAPARPEINAPGTGSVAPVPPSASTPLPAENPSAPLPAAATPPAPDIGAQTAAPATGKQLVYPVQGSIIRAYAEGRNEGIDIGAPAGTDVKAAAAGTVAAVTRNTDGITIVVIRHEGSLLTVYTHLDNLTVAKDASVRQGQVIGKVRAGDPSFLHFEVRRGMQSVDPVTMLP